MKKRLSAVILAAAMALYLLPVTAFAAGESGIQLGTDRIASPVRDTATVYHYIYFGNNGTNPIKWRVLDAAKGNAMGAADSLSDGVNTVANSGAMFLLSDSFIGRSAFNASNSSSAYHVSDVRTTLDGATNDTSLRKTYFSATEQSAILGTTKSDADYAPFPTAANPILNGDMLFLLSAQEAFSTDYFPDISDRASGGSWLLRSPSGKFKVYFQAIGIMSAGVYSSLPVANSYYLRPAFNFDKSSVLFTSAADGGGQNSTFAAPAAYNGTEWKLTLKDGNNFATGATKTSGDAALYVGYAAETLTFRHAALSTFTGAGYTDVTAALTDATGKLLYYGSINANTDATSSSVTIPAGLALGSYTLSLYGEDRNAANTTDYATGTPFTQTITVSAVPALAFADSDNYNVPAGTLGATYTASTAITATGGTSPYTFTVDPAVSGMTINGDNKLVYTRPAAQGATTATIKVTDSASPAASATIEITVGAVTAALPTVTSVAVSPATASVAKGGAQSFIAIVKGTNSPAQTVTWSVTGNASASTTISGNTLTVGSDETAASLTVTATSTVDTTKSGTAAVTVTSPTMPGSEPRPIQYQITEGQNIAWTKGGSNGLRFTANGDYGKFVNGGSVSVDGSFISSDKYSSQSGSTIVTLKASYLETLSVGRHTLRVNFTDGYAETHFTIGGYIDIPKTGDNSMPGLWMGIALIAGAGLATSVVLGRKKRQNG